MWSSLFMLFYEIGFELFSDCIVHEEGREGFASFFEKRKPYWNVDK